MADTTRSIIYLIVLLSGYTALVDLMEVDNNNSLPLIPHRLEVEFIRFEDFGGIKSDGRKCDTFFGSSCDPLLYASIEVEGVNPLIASPEKTGLFELIIYSHNRNFFDVNRIIRKDICKSAVSGVFVRVIDYDLLKTDLMEDFSCPISEINELAASEEVEWSEVDQCKATYQPGKIKLSFRWRRTPLNATECNQLPSSFYRPYRQNLLLGTTRVSRSTPANTMERQLKSYSIGNSDHSDDYSVMSQWKTTTLKRNKRNE
ncbi:hypothetical protein BV898_03269 [Hypsibius exemplaris]|uniref:Uncharacterized protein n=1 Tax=Hypsibius exemplaris TaxID=2072580 RepID=A0A1W0X5L6_HYPEX|nr:hypothetical protein BV898_03269 [Hypsibius exemplaris]